MLYILAFNYITHNFSDAIDTNAALPTDLKESYQNDIDFIRKIETDSKKISCMALIRNNLFSENKEVEEILETTTFDKVDVFDRIVLSMFDHCEKNMNFTVSEFNLTPDEIGKHNPEMDQFIQFDKDSILKNPPNFTQNERELLNFIYSIKVKTEKGKSMREHSDDLEFSDDDNLIKNLVIEKDPISLKHFGVGVAFGFIFALIIKLVVSLFSKKKESVVAFTSNKKISPNKKKN